MSHRRLQASLGRHRCSPTSLVNSGMERDLNNRLVPSHRQPDIVIPTPLDRRLTLLQMAGVPAGRRRHSFVTPREEPAPDRLHRVTCRYVMGGSLHSAGVAWSVSNVDNRERTP
jgi:hypothetical protein